MLSVELARLQAWAVLPSAHPDTSPLADAELRDFGDWVADQPPAAQQEALAALPALLPAADPLKGAAVLVMAGGRVENGADPETLFPAALAFLESLRSRQEAGEPVPADAWRYTVMALMAMLTRSAANRRQLQAQPELLAWLEEHDELSDHFQYLAHLAAVSDEDALWVIFPAYGTGLEVAVEQVNNVFHLLTLVQPLVREQAAALRLARPPGPTAPAVLAYARGETYDPPAEPDHARLEWLTAEAYQGPGRDLHHGSVAWGEAPVSALPRVRGHVLLLATDAAERMRRSWDAGFLTSVHDTNRAQVQLRRLLPAAEVQALLAELVRRADEPRQWPAPPPPPAAETPVAEAPSEPPASEAPAPEASVARPAGFWRRLLGR